MSGINVGDWVTVNNRRGLVVYVHGECVDVYVRVDPQSAGGSDWTIYAYPASVLTVTAAATYAQTPKPFYVNADADDPDPEPDDLFTVGNVYWRVLYRGGGKFEYASGDVVTTGTPQGGRVLMARNGKRWRR